MIRKLVLIGSALGLALLAVFDGYSAMASGTPVLQTVSKTENIVSARCYHTHQVTTSYYRWSSTTGYTKLVAPKRTVTDSTTCHK